jgi:hypothetical protein
MIDSCYVYIHLNPDTNEVFYVGKGTGNRMTSHKSRNELWQEYVRSLKSDFRSLKVKVGLTDSEALLLESQIIERIEFHYEDRLTNIDKSDNMYARDGTAISFFNSNEEKIMSPRFGGSTDEQIVSTLSDFPNRENRNLLAFDETIDSIWDDFCDEMDDLEEIDEDHFFDLEYMIQDLIEESSKVLSSESLTLSEYVEELKSILDINEELSSADAFEVYYERIEDAIKELEK